MRLSFSRVSAMASAILLATTLEAGLAQAPPSNMAIVAAQLAAGERISVLATNGSMATGTLRSWTPDFLTLDVGSTPKTVASREIQTVSRVRDDKLRNGMLVGVAVG